MTDGERKLNETRPLSHVAQKTKLFSNPTNIGVSVNELELFLRPTNDKENTQEFIDAVMKVYTKGSVKDEKKTETEDKFVEPFLPNAVQIWENWDTNKEHILSLLSDMTRIHEDDIRCLGYIFDAVSELRNKTENDTANNDIAANGVRLATYQELQELVTKVGEIEHSIKKK